MLYSIDLIIYTHLSLYEHEINKKNTDYYHWNITWRSFLLTPSKVPSVYRHHFWIGHTEANSEIYLPCCIFALSKVNITNWLIDLYWSVYVTDIPIIPSFFIVQAATGAIEVFGSRVSIMMCWFRLVNLSWMCWVTMGQWVSSTSKISRETLNGRTNIFSSK